MQKVIKVIKDCVASKTCCEETGADCNQCRNCPAREGTHKPAEAVHQIEERQPTIEAIISDMRRAHAATTQGKWSKGETTHNTVARRGAGKPYKVAYFRHADDAQFCDLAHAFVPRLIEEIERQREQLSAIGAGGVESLRKQVAPSAVAVPDERVAFEVWQESEGGYRTERGFGKQNDCQCDITRRMWEAWRARAALAATTSVSNASSEAAPVILPEPVTWLIERSAFHVSPHGQDAESNEWLEEAHEPGEEGSFPVYTEQQVRALLATGGQAQAKTQDERKSGCAESNRYCHARMCLAEDAEHEHDCPAGRSSIAAAKGE